MKLRIWTEEWPIDPPLVIARGTMNKLEVVLVELTDGSHKGIGEAVGVPYAGETGASLAKQIERQRRVIEDGVTRAQLLDILPPGGARNALDCALWDLAAKQTAIPAWRLAGLDRRPVLDTAVTIGIGTPDFVRRRAEAFRDHPLLKVKLDAQAPVDTVALVRKAAPDARIIVDPNQAWSIDLLNEVAGPLADLGVALIEQPLRRGDDALLERYCRAVPVAADESCNDRADLALLPPVYDVINIKLDKAGGLTEALALADMAEAQGMGIMVGCMAGTSLSMMPAMMVGARAAFVDLDGPLLHRRDRPGGIHYRRGRMEIDPSPVWGG